jgi:hypothetical protein
VLQVLRALEAQPELRAFRDQLGHKALRAEQQDHKELLDRREQQVLWDQMVLKDRRVKQVPQVLQVTLDQLVPKVLLDKQDKRVLQVLRE